MEQEIERILSVIHTEITDEKQIPRVLDDIFRTMYDLLFNKKNSDVDHILQQTDIEKSHYIILVGLLTITIPRKEMLKERTCSNEHPSSSKANSITKRQKNY